MKKYIILLVLLVNINRVSAQSNTVNSGSTLPGICTTGSVYITTSGPTLNLCSTPNTWTAFSFIPSGTISLVTTGTCNTGWTEVSALNGRMLRGTIAANGNVGTTSGSDSITPTVASLTAAAQIFTGNSVVSSAVSGGTPSGTNGTVNITPLGTVTAPVFTGNALTTHFHELPVQLVSNVLTRFIASATFGTGTSRAAIGQVTDTANTTSAAVALSEAKTAGTPAGTNSVPTFTGSSTVVGAETFTGNALSTHTHTTTATGTNGTSTVTGTLNSFDNRPAYTNVIFCSKN